MDAHRGALPYIAATPPLRSRYTRAAQVVPAVARSGRGCDERDVRVDPRLRQARGRHQGARRTHTHIHAPVRPCRVAFCFRFRARNRLELHDLMYRRSHKGVLHIPKGVLHIPKGVLHIPKGVLYGSPFQTVLSSHLRRGTSRPQGYFHSRSHRSTSTLGRAARRARSRSSSTCPCPSAAGRASSARSSRTRSRPATPKRPRPTIHPVGRPFGPRRRASECPVGRSTSAQQLRPTARPGQRAPTRTARRRRCAACPRRRVARRAVWIAARLGCGCSCCHGWTHSNPTRSSCRRASTRTAATTSTMGSSGVRAHAQRVLSTQLCCMFACGCVGVWVCVGVVVCSLVSVC